MDDRPLLLTDDSALRDEVLALAAAAGVELGHDPQLNAARWRSAPLVLIDTALVGRAVAAGLARRAGVVAVAVEAPDAAGWEHCVRLGVERTVVVREAEQYLVGLLSDLDPGGTSDGRCVAVLGACGGAGASVLSAALAVCAARTTALVLLADCDPWGPGLDVLLGVEGGDGLRWNDIAAPSGRLAAEVLHRALPRVPLHGGQVSVLCQDRFAAAEPSPALVDVLIDSARRAGSTLVCDLPRAPGAAADRVLTRADLTVLVAPADVRGCFAATRLRPRLDQLGARCGLVVRGPSPGGLGGEDLAEVLGLPLLATMRPQPGLDRDIERGVPAGLPQRGPLARAAATVLEQLDLAAVQRPSPRTSRPAA